MSVHLEEQELPVFPLTGSLLLPGTYLPLNIFEDRYRNMVQDALEGGGMIGMIQPRVPGLDNYGIQPLQIEAPDLYAVGCCGRIERHELQDDGRYLIVLEGIVRFRVLREIEPMRGYRRVVPGFSEFELDLRAEEPEIDTVEILSVLDRFAQERELEFDTDLLASLTGRRLINTLSTALPFTAVEKQTLLEAQAPEDRAALLITLMGIESDSSTRSQSYSPPTIH